MSRHEALKVNIETAKKALSELERNPQNRQAYNVLVSMADREKANIEFWEKEVEKLNRNLQVMIKNYNLLSEKVDKGAGWVLENVGKLSKDEYEAGVEDFKYVCNLKAKYLVVSSDSQTGKIVEIADFANKPDFSGPLKFEDFKLKKHFTENLDLFTAYKRYSDNFKKNIITQEQLELMPC